MRSIPGFIGIRDIIAYRAEDMAIPRVQDTSLKHGL